MVKKIRVTPVFWIASDTCKGILVFTVPINCRYLVEHNPNYPSITVHGIFFLNVDTFTSTIRDFFVWL